MAQRWIQAKQPFCLKRHIHDHCHFFAIPLYISPQSEHLKSQLTVKKRTHDGREHGSNKKPCNQAGGKRFVQVSKTPFRDFRVHTAGFCSKKAIPINAVKIVPSLRRKSSSPSQSVEHFLFL